MGLFGKTKTYDFETVTTKGGDSGQSSLYNERREYKDGARFTLIGELDELQSLIGLMRARFDNDLMVPLLREVQEQLYDYMAIVATESDSELYEALKKPQESHIEGIEKHQKIFLDDTDIPQKFIIPGDSNEVSAWLDYIRTVVRRNERACVHFIRSVDIYTAKRIDFDDMKLIQKYLNRLSDYFFIVARYLEQV